jgi:nuclease-like protein
MRRRTERERSMRARLGLFGVGLVRLAGDPPSTGAWRRGADGEAKVASRLTKLLSDSGVHLLHDRRLAARGHANIDHLAVGPGGITVIDAKALRGKVRIETVGGLFGERRRLLRVAGHDRTRLVRAVQAQAELVRERLAGSGLDAIEVRCALCFADTDGLPWLGRLELDGVVLAGPRRVAKLARRPGSLGETDVRRVLYALAKALAPA